MCRVIHSSTKMRSDGNVSKSQAKAVRQSIFLGYQLDVFAALRRLLKPLLDTVLKALHVKNPPDHHRAFAFKLSVKNTVTCVQPSDLCQFTHINSILSLGCVGN